MATKPHERAFALVGALLFLATAVATAVIVVWQAQQDKKNQQAAQDVQSQIEQQTQKEGKLEGTQLADFTPVTTVDSLQKIDVKEGTGEEVKPGDTVTVHYTGAVAGTGIIFQSSKDTGQPVSFPLSSVIKGWTDGVPGMKVGGTRRLIIPADQAYGANPPAGSGIPANAPLVFDIELVKIGE